MNIRRKILPVIDIKAREVVHGVGGSRELYQPINSLVTDSHVPHVVADKICDIVGVTDVYVADLDAINGAAVWWEEIQTMVKCGLRVWLDAGLIPDNEAKRFLDLSHGNRVIVGLESLPKLRQLESIVQELPAESLVFSVDMQEGTPITKDPIAQKLSPETIATFAIETGIRSIILLDLAAVGGETRPMTEELCTNIRARNPDIEIISGGGVRHIEDVTRFTESGCDRVLVATALHNATIGNS